MDTGISGEHTGHTKDTEEARRLAHTVRTGEDGDLSGFSGEGELVGGAGAARVNGEAGDSDAAGRGKSAGGISLWLAVGELLGQSEGGESAVGGMLAIFGVVEF